MPMKNGRRVGDDIEPVGEADPERALALAKHEEGLTQSQDRHRAKDVLPVPIKTSSLVPLPSGERNEVSYASDLADPDDMTLPELEKEINSLLSKYKRTKLEEARLRFLTDAEMDKKRKATKTTDGRSRDRGRFVKMRDSKEKTKATDMLRTNLNEQRSGSEPADHLFRAAQYEIGGDRARALDSYRAAAGGYRRAGDQAGEQKAKDGIMFCQSAFDTQYDHPGIGRVRVCDSVDIALRTALERTRAGEQVHVEGKTVRPGFARAKDGALHAYVPDKDDRCAICGRPANDSSTHKDAAQYDAHGRDAAGACENCGAKTSGDNFLCGKCRAKAKDDTGGPPPVDNPATPAVPDPVPTDDSAFSKLEHKLEAGGESKKEAGGVAYKVGAEKYGKAGMAKKAAEGRSKDHSMKRAKARDKREVLPV